jgi:hypothetical protein
MGHCFKEIAAIRIVYRVRAAVLREMKLIFPLWFTICRSNANLHYDVCDSSGR